MNKFYHDNFYTQGWKICTPDSEIETDMDIKAESSITVNNASNTDNCAGEGKVLQWII